MSVLNQPAHAARHGDLDACLGQNIAVQKEPGGTDTIAGLAAHSPKRVRPDIDAIAHIQVALDTNFVEDAESDRDFVRAGFEGVHRPVRWMFHQWPSLNRGHLSS